MNNTLSNDHPPEERLMEFAFEGGAPEVERHLSECGLCAKTVEEFRAVKQRVASLDDEEVPEGLERRVLGITHHGHSPGLFSGLTALFANPFLIALLVALVVILLSLLVFSEVLKSP
jgi:anti-sigma factor RsiW